MCDSWPTVNAAGDEEAEDGAGAVSAADEAAGEAVGKAPLAKRKLADQLAQYMDLDGVLSCCERLWPQWADNGCRMIELVRPPAKTSAGA